MDDANARAFDVSDVVEVAGAEKRDCDSIHREGAGEIRHIPRGAGATGVGVLGRRSWRYGRRPSRVADRIRRFVERGGHRHDQRGAAVREEVADAVAIPEPPRKFPEATNDDQHDDERCQQGDCSVEVDKAVPRPEEPHRRPHQEDDDQHRGQPRKDPLSARTVRSALCAPPLVSRIARFSAR